jgi:glutaconate CoA-transferase subunit B
MAKLDPRAFPADVDFLTSAGHRCRGVPRRELDLPGAGPVKVITDKAILEADPKSGELVLVALYPGVTADEVRAGVGWPLVVRTTLLEVSPPTPRELQLLREVLDPKRLFLRG